jgi:ABC-type amino acid transport substrate-binding protein
MLHMLKERSLAAMTALCLLMLAGQASAASPVLDRVVKQGVVKVGMSANQPPFNARSREGKMIGLEVDLANTLAAMLRVELEIVEKPFGELLGALEKGEVDMVMSGMAITGERARKATFVGPYMLSGKSILTKSSTLAAAREAGEINKSSVRLAALDNSTSQEFVEKVLPQAKLTKVKNYDEGVAMVLDDKVDALVADMPICVLSVLRYPDAGLATLTRPMTVEPIGIAVSAKDPQFSNIIDNYIDALEKTGTLNQLRAKWLEDGSWIAALP